MRRSPGMGGGSVLRAAENGLAHVKEAVSSGSSAGTPLGRVRIPPARVASSGNTASPTSSPSFGSASKAAAAANASGGWNSHCTFLGDGEEWERVGVEELDDGGGVEQLVFATAPSEEEAEDAVSMLQQIFIPVRYSQVTDDGFLHLVSDAVFKKPSPSDSSEKVSSAELSSESESDWIEPAMHVYTNSSSSRQREKVVDAFRLIHMNPSLQRMVVSLSSDKAVWDAVMKNEVVQELKKYVSAEDNETEDSNDHENITGGTLTCFFQNMKAKFMEFVEKIMRLVNDDTFHSQEKNKNTNIFDGAVKTSFMLSVMVFIFVVVARINKV